MNDNDHPFQDHASIITVIAMQSIVVYSNEKYDIWDFIISFLCFLFGIRVFNVGYSDQLNRILIASNAGLSGIYSVTYCFYFLYGIFSQKMDWYSFLQQPIERVIGLDESHIIAFVELKAVWIVNFLEPNLIEKILEIHVSEIASILLILIYIFTVPRREQLQNMTEHRNISKQGFKAIFRFCADSAREMLMKKGTAFVKHVMQKLSGWRPRKFWWGIFFGALIGVLLLAPDSNFSNRIRDVFYTLQDSTIAVWDAALTDPITAILAFSVGAAIFAFLIACVDFFIPHPTDADARIVAERASKGKQYIGTACAGFLGIVLTTYLDCSHVGTTNQRDDPSERSRSTN